MPKGIPVVIAVNGYGTPVTPVQSGAPVMQLSPNGLGVPVVITENGAPFVFEGIEPDHGEWQASFIVAGHSPFGWGFGKMPLVSSPLGTIINEPYSDSELIGFFEAPDDSRMIVCFTGNILDELEGHTFSINGKPLKVFEKASYNALTDWTIMFLESLWLIEGDAYVIVRIPDADAA